MRRFYPETFLIALAVILLEVSYTRVFSYKLVYYFTYLIIGVSLLGLGSGGVFVAISDRLRRTAPERIILMSCVVAAVSVLASYLLVALVPLNLFQMMMGFAQGALRTPLWTLAKLSLALLSLYIPFLAAGVALSTIFATHTEKIARLYFVDLLGAALGAAIVIPALTLLTPPGVVFLAGLVFAVAGARLAREIPGLWRNLCLAATAVLLVGVILPNSLPDPIRDKIKGGEATGSAFTQWDPVFRVDVVPFFFGEPRQQLLYHDGTIGSSMTEWNGDMDALGRYDTMDRAHPFRLLPPGPNIAIVGSAGGNEILAGLHFGARKITGIELNPVTVSLLENEFAEFTGNLTANEKVTVVNAEGRAFLKGSGENYDLIWLVAPDSYAAMNAATSGAFVLSESYLYTKEMVEDVVEHLTEDGILCAQFGELDFNENPNRTIRYLGTARLALAELGIRDFERHVMVGVSPGYGRLETTTIIIKKSPFTEADIATFRATTGDVEGARVSFVWSAPELGSPVTTVILGTPDELEKFYTNFPYKVRPITDDSPFFWHFVGLPEALFGSDRTGSWNVEEGVGERLLIAFLLLAIGFAALFLLLPLVFLRKIWSEIPYKWNSGIYFAALGLGFMFIEVCLIQRLTLFLGYPTYSLTVTLFALLVSTGIGSLLSERYATRRNQAFTLLLMTLAGLIAFYEFVLPWVADVGMAWSFPTRVGVTILCLTPLGLCLGAFMPLGLRSVSETTEHGDQYVAWCWAINGFFSVMASVLATLLSMTYGFNAVMIMGFVIYALGIAAFRRVPTPGN
jgi:MFS family permease